MSELPSDRLGAVEFEELRDKGSEEPAILLYTRRKLVDAGSQ